MKKDLWQRAEELFHNALEHSPEARRAFLDKACGEDAELRRQVETLLSQDEQAGSFLEKPALAGAIAEESHHGRQDTRPLSHLQPTGQGRNGRSLIGRTTKSWPRCRDQDLARRVRPRSRTVLRGSSAKPKCSPLSIIRILPPFMGWRNPAEQTSLCWNWSKARRWRIR